MLKTIFIFTIASALILFSCNKHTQQTQKVEAPETEVDDSENDSDSTMTPEELFSSALVENIVGDNEDDDLEIYLEEQIYPLVSKSDKVTLDKISSSVYLLSYNENGVMKNFVIQKFYNPVKDEFVFEKSETQTNAVKQFVK